MRHIVLLAHLGIKEARSAHVIILDPKREFMNDSHLVYWRTCTIKTLVSNANNRVDPTEVAVDVDMDSLLQPRML